MKPTCILCTGILLAMILAASGCAPKSKPVTYHLLALSENQERAERPDPELPCLQVGPVTVAPYLNRANLVDRATPWTLTYEESHRWAEPLERGVSRVIAKSLSAKGVAKRTPIFPSDTGATCNGPKLKIEICRFDVTSGETARLQIRWQLIDAGAETLSGEETLEQPLAAEATMEARVSAMSGLLYRFCDTIKEKIGS